MGTGTRSPSEVFDRTGQEVGAVISLGGTLLPTLRLRNQSDKPEAGSTKGGQRRRCPQMCPYPHGANPQYVYIHTMAVFIHKSDRSIGITN